MRQVGYINPTHHALFFPFSPSPCHSSHFRKNSLSLSIIMREIEKSSFEQRCVVCRFSSIKRHSHWVMACCLFASPSSPLFENTLNHQRKTKISSASLFSSPFENTENGTSRLICSFHNFNSCSVCVLLVSTLQF
jgi:hypothetical protein